MARAGDEGAPAGAREGRRRRRTAGTLSNLCVDVFHSVEPGYLASLRALRSEGGGGRIERQIAAIKAREGAPAATLELGGNCNFALAAARLGLDTKAIGVLGGDELGAFVAGALREEDVDFVDMLGASVDASRVPTLECNVVVEPNGQHGFFSLYDSGAPFGHALGQDGRGGEGLENFRDGRLCAIADSAMRVVRGVDVLFCNGFSFDELHADLVLSTARAAKEAGGAAVLFDAGPRLARLRAASGDTFLQILGISDVILATEEEAQTMTGIPPPADGADEAAARVKQAELHALHILDLAAPGGAPGRKLAVVKLGELGSLFAERGAMDGGPCVSFEYFPGFSVPRVGDTVGCGDSFAAAVGLGLAHGADLRTTSALANAVGAATASRSGAGRNVATREAVVRLLTDGLAPAAGAGGGDRCEAIRRAISLLDEVEGGA